MLGPGSLSSTYRGRPLPELACRIKPPMRVFFPSRGT